MNMAKTMEKIFCNGANGTCKTVNPIILIDDKNSDIEVRCVRKVNCYGKPNQCYCADLPFIEGRNHTGQVYACGYFKK
jgi:hypothetical protein